MEELGFLLPEALSRLVFEFLVQDFPLPYNRLGFQTLIFRFPVQALLVLVEELLEFQALLGLVEELLEFQALLGL